VEGGHRWAGVAQAAHPSLRGIGARSEAASLTTLTPRRPPPTLYASWLAWGRSQWYSVTAGLIPAAIMVSMTSL
jgi:hypothetical protein